MYSLYLERLNYPDWNPQVYSSFITCLSYISIQTYNNDKYSSWIKQIQTMHSIKMRVKCEEKLYKIMVLSVSILTFISSKKILNSCNHNIWLYPVLCINNSIFHIFVFSNSSAQYTNASLETLTKMICLNRPADF